MNWSLRNDPTPPTHYNDIIIIIIIIIGGQNIDLFRQTVTSPLKATANESEETYDKSEPSYSKCRLTWSSRGFLDTDVPGNAV